MNTESEKKTADNKIINFENVEVNIKIKQIVTSERDINKAQEIVSNEENKKQTPQGQETIKSNTISGAIFAMTALSIGTGCLTFTKKIIQFGFVWFGVTLILGGIATYWTLSGLIRAARKKGDSEYSSIVKKELGSFPAMLVDIMTCLYSWGLIITYEIIMNTLVGRVIYVFFKDDEPIYPTFGTYDDKVWDKLKIKALVLGTINIVLIPLCILKDISKMKFFSLFGIIALFYTIIVLVIQSYFYWDHYLDNVYLKDDSSTHANWYDITRAFNGNLDFFTGFATIVFSFSCHQGALPVYRSLNPNDDKVMTKVFSRSIILDLIIYFMIYIASFLTNPLKSDDLIIFRESIFNNDIFMNIAKIAIFLELFFLIPSNYNSFRCSLFHIIFGNENIRTIPNIAY